MAGIVTEVPFPTYPNGFPPEVVDEFTRIVGQTAARKQDRFGHGDHRRTRARAHPKRTSHPLYICGFGLSGRRVTKSRSAPVLYDWCERARAMLVPPHGVNRVIARPFVGSPGAFVANAEPPGLCHRTARQHPRPARGPRACPFTPSEKSANLLRARYPDVRTRRRQSDAMEKTFESAGTGRSRVYFCESQRFRFKVRTSPQRPRLRRRAASARHADSPVWSRCCAPATK